ncbi:MAG: SpoIIIAC/SpoIIIAD family protein, partial [Christensenellales bacterium]
MDIVKIIIIGVVTSIATVVLKQFKPELSIIVSLAGGVIILISLVNYLGQVVGSFVQIVNKTSLDLGLFSSVLKIVGVGYITEFGANICVDTGNSSIADKVLLAGKIIILCLSLPIINSLLTTIVGI